MCNILSVEQIQKIMPDDDGPYEPSQLTAEQLKDKLLNYHYILDLLDTTLIALNKSDQNDESIKNSIEKTNKRKTHIQNLLEKTEKKLSSLRDLRDLHLAKLKIIHKKDNIAKIKKTSS